MKKVIWFVACVFFVMFASRASAATITVNSGESIQTKCVNVANPGDSCVINGGTYNENISVSRSGVSGNPILITNAVGSEVVISGFINISGNYVTVNGLRVKSPSGDAITVKGGDFVVLESLNIEHPFGRGIKADGYSNPVNNFTVRNTRVDTTAGINCVNPQQLDSIYMQYGTDPVIEGNTLINRGGCSVIPEGPHIDNVQTYYMDNITIRNNHLEFVSGSGSGASQPTMITYFDGFVKFYNNVVIANQLHSNGAVIGFEDGGNGSEIYIVNNTFKAQHPNGSGLSIASVDPNSIKAIKNNIFITGQNGGYAFYIDTSINFSVIDYNILDNNNYSYGVAFVGQRYSWSAWQAAGFDPHGYNVDPGLNDVLEPDSINDPSVNKGLTISDFSFDKKNVARPQGAAWDIGAYEYMGTAKAGDSNNDGLVDGVDYTIWLNHYNQSASGPAIGDFNNSGKVDGVDYIVWLNNYGK